MATFNGLLEQSAQERAQVLDDIKAWREANEAWVRNQQALSDKFGRANPGLILRREMKLAATNIGKATQAGPEAASLSDAALH
jgi:hypothetical protein